MATGQGPGVVDAPSVSIEDRTIVGSIDRGLNSTIHIPKVGSSQNR